MMKRGLLLLLLLIPLLNDCIAQTINFTGKNVPPRPFFKAIEKQSKYAFVYLPVNLNKAVNLDLEFKNASVQQALDEYFSKQPRLKYQIFDMVIVVIPKHPNPEPETTTQKKSTATVKGRVMDEKGNPLPGATVVVKSTAKGTYTDENGYFELQDVTQDASLEISYVAHESQVVKPQMHGINEFRLSKREADIFMEPVVNTGYQALSKKMETGSVSQVSNGTLNRSNWPDVISRIGSLVPGLRLDPSLRDGDVEFSIRGLSTYFANKRPLIVLDNFPYDGDINNINPNDIEKIDILKDAAAAAIWGARSGNGVIVITSRKAKHNKPLSILISSNLSVKAKPDVFYNPHFMPSRDLLMVEEFLTNRGFFDRDLQDRVTRPAVTPGVAVFAKRRAGLISAADSASQIDALAGYDVRKDFDEYFYRQAFVQQYTLHVTGGNAKAAFILSGSFDKDPTNLTYNEYSRFVISTSSSFNPVPRLQIHVTGTYTERQAKTGNSGWGSVNMYNRQLYGYAKFADDYGNPLSTVYKYDQSVHDSIPTPFSLRYEPLNELKNADNKTILSDKRLEASIKYRIAKGLRVDMIGLYENQTSVNTDIQSMERFHTRDMITGFYNPTAVDERKRFPIPQGGIITTSNADLKSVRGRAQLNYERTFNLDHFVTGIVGIETGKITMKGLTLQQYGYDARTGNTRSDLDYQTLFPGYMGLMQPATITYLSKPIGTLDINRSLYSNFSYNYANKYTITASARKDWSNLLGVEFNKRAVVLWSAGVAWELTREPFFYVPALPYVRIRSSYGYTGNIDKSASGLVTLSQPLSATGPGTYWSTVQNAPNAQLGWEKTRIFNLGLDLRVASFLSAVIEYYNKSGNNLVGVLPVAPSTGLPGLGLTYMANATGLKTRGVDVQVQANILRNKFRWTAGLTFAYNKDKVTRYDSLFSALRIMQSADRHTSVITPIVGKPLAGIYSYRWAGLEANTGDPLGFVADKESNDYARIINTNYTDLVYHGSARPVYFGALTNTFSHKGFTLFVNISYRLGYYFRASTINYQALYSSGAMHQDFTKRWQRPGDEKHTSVPSMPEPDPASLRDEFYAYSEKNVHRADNIRLDDVRLSYDFEKFKWGKMNFNIVSVYVQGTNMGILWKANKVGRDPDYPETFPVSRILSAGVKADF